jgi:hypothetical protein
MQKNRTIVPLIIIAALLTLTAVVLTGHMKKEKQANSYDIEITNRTGQTIKAIYIARTATYEWTENLLEKSIADGDKGSVPFDRKVIFNLWDIKAEFADGSEKIWRRLYMPYIYEMTLKPEGEPEYVEIKNST